ncbi:histone-lysine N-methyltransferase setd3-like, partial [Trifolium medium]|nr:histone-lysine N-methyltransferase setd3-like [Trifolium medium]
VLIQCDIPKQDPLRNMKLELLHQYFVPPTKERIKVLCMEEETLMLEKHVEERDMDFKK